VRIILYEVVVMRQDADGMEVGDFTRAITIAMSDMLEQLKTRTRPGVMVQFVTEGRSDISLEDAKAMVDALANSSNAKNN